MMDNIHPLCWQKVVNSSQSKRYKALPIVIVAGGVCHPIVLRPVHLERGFSGVFGAVTSRHLPGQVGLKTLPPESKEMQQPARGK